MQIAGRVPADGSKSWNAEQWKQVARVVAEAARVTEDFGLDLVFHPHISTYVETMKETEQFFDATSSSGIGLCLDTGHCAYAGGDSAEEAEKYRENERAARVTDPTLRERFSSAVPENVATLARARAWLGDC